MTPRTLAALKASAPTHDAVENAIERLWQEHRAVTESADDPGTIYSDTALLIEALAAERDFFVSLLPEGETV